MILDSSQTQKEISKIARTNKLRKLYGGKKQSFQSKILKKPNRDNFRIGLISKQYDNLVEWSITTWANELKDYDAHFPNVWVDGVIETKNDLIHLKEELKKIKRKFKF